MADDATKPDPSNPTEPTKPEPAKEPEKDTSKPKPEDTDGRISELSSTIKELKTKLKARDDDDKKSAEQKLKEEGKLKELLESKEKELGELLPLKDQNKAYEEAIGASVKASITAIEDKEKRAAVEKMLEGLSVLDQYKKLPELLKLMGSPADTSFGGNTPAGKKDTEAGLSQKRARFNELLAKDDLKPAERAEKNRLQIELSAEFQKEQAKKRSESTK